MLFEQAITDTAQEVEKVQINLLRQAGQARRIELMLSLSQSVFELSRHNLSQTYPQLSMQEQNVKFVELLYGPQLAKSLQAFLQTRDE